MEFRETKRAFSGLYSLYFKPTTFFSNKQLLTSNWLIFWATALYGVSGFFERVEQKVIRYNMDVGAESKEAFLNAMVSNWWAIWSAAIGIGVISCFLIWWIGGWFYNLRIKWSGGSVEDKELGRSLYVVSNIVYALPFLLGMVIATFTYKDYLSFNSDNWLFAIATMLFTLWSLIASYKAVRVNFGVKKWLAIWWFVVAPVIAYTLILTMYVFAGMYAI